MNPSARLPFWGVSLLIVVGMHAAVLFWALFWHPQATPVELTPTAMLIELEPMAPPPTPQQKAAPPEPQPQPKLIEAPKPKLVLQQPKPKPKPIPPQPEVKQEPKPPQDLPQVVTREKESVAPIQAPPQQQRNTGEIDRERALWMAKVQAYLGKRLRYPEREKRFSKSGITPSISLEFTIDSQGRVLSSEVTNSNARSSFGQDIKRQLRRISPLPAPPEKVQTRFLTIPLTFNLK